MLDPILESRNQCVRQCNSAGRLVMIILLATTILTAGWGIPQITWLCRKVEDFANICFSVFTGVGRLIGNLSYKEVDRERGSAKSKPTIISKVTPFTNVFGTIYFSYMTLTT